MNIAPGTLRRRRRVLGTRRRKAEGSAARARNARIALAGFVLLAVGITFGVRTALAPAPIRITSMRVPTDAASLRFAENHLGRLFFDSVEGAVWREIKFNNDTGRFSDERTMRCDEPSCGRRTSRMRRIPMRARAPSRSAAASPAADLV